MPVANMPHCDNCDTHVSDQFARVFADDGGRIRACPGCAANAGIAQQVLERKDVEPA